MARTASPVIVIGKAAADGVIADRNTACFELGRPCFEAGNFGAGITGARASGVNIPIEAEPSDRIGETSAWIVGMGSAASG
jgi:hypothetical protein